MENTDFESHKANQIGKELEHEVFEGFRLALSKIQAKNTVVFTGLKLRDGDSKKQLGEIDFLIVSQELKAIMQVGFIHKLMLVFNHPFLFVSHFITKANHKS